MTRMRLIRSVRSTVMISDARRHQLPDGDAGQMSGLPVGRLREEPGDETQSETGIARGHRLFAHIRRRLHRGKGSEKK